MTWGASHRINKKVLGPFLNLLSALLEVKIWGTECASIRAMNTIEGGWEYTPQDCHWVNSLRKCTSSLCHIGARGKREKISIADSVFV